MGMDAGLVPWLCRLQKQLLMFTVMQALGVMHWATAPPVSCAGYGNTGPQACWAAAWLIAIQIIVALLLESIVIGIVFA
jgi:hypothetical protein